CPTKRPRGSLSAFTKECSMRSTASSKKPRKRPSKTLRSRASASMTSKPANRPAINRHQGSSIDDFLREEGVSEVFQARAIKEVIAWQLEQAMKEQNL